jgi:hypothetical protein
MICSGCIVVYYCISLFTQEGIEYAYAAIYGTLTKTHEARYPISLAGASRCWIDALSPSVERV